MNSYGSVWNALAVLGERSAESFLVLIQINVGCIFADGRRNCFVAARVMKRLSTSLVSTRCFFSLGVEKTLFLGEAGDAANLQNAR